MLQKNYHDSLSETYKLNTRKTWSTIKEVIGKRKTDELTSSFKFCNITITDKHRIANGFNKYFLNVGPTLSNKIPHQYIGPEHYLRGSYMPSFFLNQVNENEIISIVNGLKNSAPGLGNIRTDLIKNVIHFITEPLTHIFNLSFTKDVFPDQIKIAKVKPIYKKVDSMISLIIDQYL